jgi:hypothetical protein
MYKDNSNDYQIMLRLHAVKQDCERIVNFLSPIESFLQYSHCHLYSLGYPADSIVKLHSTLEQTKKMAEDELNKIENLMKGIK